jgi:hypothetical protein
MENVHVISRPKFQVLSNGGVRFGASLILCTDKTIQRNSACIQPLFSAYRTQLTGKPSAPFERTYDLDLETIFKILHLICICIWFLPLSDAGMHTNRYVYMRAAYASISGNISIVCICTTHTDMYIQNRCRYKQRTKAVSRI